MSTRLEVMEKIIDCRACELYKVGSGPIPFSGPSPADFAILGEAPGREEDAKGRPFTGPSGKLLRTCLEAAGLDVERSFIFNTASCFPAGTPTAAQVASCRPHFLRQLALSGTGPVLVLGSTALGAFRSDLRMTKARGHVFTVDERVLVASFHPAYILRSQPEREPVFRSDIARFAAVVANPEQWSSQILNQCVYCSKPEEQMDTEHVDAAGLVFCEECWPKSPGGRRPVLPVRSTKPVSPPIVLEAKPVSSSYLKTCIALVKQVFPGTVEVPA